MQILVAGAEGISSGIVGAFKRLGYAVDWAPGSVLANQLLRSLVYDLIVLDLSLAPAGGFHVLQCVRARHQLATPILTLSATTGIEERVRALDGGADDHMAIPFDSREFEARARCLLRRQSGASTNQLVCSRIALDLEGRTASVDGRPLDLARRELCLLEVLIANPGRVFSKDFLLRKIYGHDSEQHENAVEVLVARLRRKLIGSDVQLTTRRGLGYCLLPLQTPATQQLPGSAAFIGSQDAPETALRYRTALR
jgi:two-component system response regulator TctD